MRRWPLRVKLVALMLALLAAALVVTSFASAIYTRNHLVSRLDEQLTKSASPAFAGCLQTLGFTGPPGGQVPGGDRGLGGPAQLNGYYIGCVDETGAVIDQPMSSPDASRAKPKLPANVKDFNSTNFTVPTVDGTGHDWRVAVVPAQSRAARGYVVVALSLDEVDRTVNSLTALNAGVGGAVLIVLALVAYVTVRSSLRPLVEVEQTAEAIAAGDLTRRVPEADPRTEVGGLAMALNGMLGQIETAFDERRTSEEAARMSEARMRRFIADASHELRTPLTSIRGFAELHRQSGRSDETIGRIEHHATRMGLLVDDLLLLARMDQQRPLDKKLVDLLALATDALIDARVTAGDHRIRLRTAGGDDEDVEPAIVLGDEARLRQVLANLLGNALTHTPAGTEITVFVGTQGSNAILEVSDNGPGMSEDDAARVFERFYRTDPSRTRALGGSGLGLSIVAALVAAHGGRVTLATTQGAGATFRVCLPLPPPP